MLMVEIACNTPCTGGYKYLHTVNSMFTCLIEILPWTSRGNTESPMKDHIRHVSQRLSLVEIEGHNRIGKHKQGMADQVV